MKILNVKFAFIGIVIISVLFQSCSQKKSEIVEENFPKKDTIISVEQEKYTEMEKKLLDFGLCDIADYDSSIAVHIVYATPYNFLGHVLYKDINHAFMLPEMAEKLCKAQKLLKTLRPDLSLLIYDAARPVGIQREMWALVKGTPNISYVANPAKGNGLHNYGAAVDITLMDCTGHPIPMGSEYDYFGKEARIDDEAGLLSSGRITQRELENRLLLRKVMTQCGFLTITSEWWHFNLMSSSRARNELNVIDFE